MFLPPLFDIHVVEAILYCIESLQESVSDEMGNFDDMSKLCVLFFHQILLGFVPKSISKSYRGITRRVY